MANIFDLFKKISAERSAAEPAPQGPVTYIVAGLGNPGTKYEGTRHNAGFMAMSYLCQKENMKIDRIRFKSLTSDAVFAGKRVLFMLPQTLMNASGTAIKEAADFYKIPIENIIIIHDDIALPCGKMRIRTHGSDGGHNGIKNIIYLCGDDGFTRVRLGVGAPPDSSQMVNWVLGKIPDCEREAFYTTIEKSYDALKLILDGQTQTAMNKFN